MMDRDELAEIRAKVASAASTFDELVRYGKQVAQLLEFIIIVSFGDTDLSRKSSITIDKSPYAISFAQERSNQADYNSKPVWRAYLQYNNNRLSQSNNPADFIAFAYDINAGLLEKISAALDTNISSNKQILTVFRRVILGFLISDSFDPKMPERAAEFYSSFLRDKLEDK